jgi:hypothetical protein
MPSTKSPNSMIGMKSRNSNLIMMLEIQEKKEKEPYRLRYRVQHRSQPPPSIVLAIGSLLGSEQKGLNFLRNFQQRKSGGEADGKAR